MTLTRSNRADPSRARPGAGGQAGARLPRRPSAPNVQYAKFWQGSLERSQALVASFRVIGHLISLTASQNGAARPCAAVLYLALD